MGWRRGIKIDTHRNPANTRACENAPLNPLNWSSAPSSGFLAVNLYHQPSSSASLMGKELVPKNVATQKNWSSNTFLPITTPPCWFQWGDIGWYWLLGVLLCFSKSFPTKARTSTHIQHIGALAARTNTNARLIGVQTSNRRVEAAHTDNLLSVGDSSPSVYIKQVHTCRHTRTQVYTPSDWPLQTCFNLPPNKLCCVLYMCVCVCVRLQK